MEKQDQELLEKARQLVKENQKARAAELIEEKLASLSDEALREPWLLELGIIYNALGDFPRALNLFNAVLRINPGQGQARTYVTMINNILNYYNKDLLNP